MNTPPGGRALEAARVALGTLPEWRRLAPERREALLRRHADQIGRAAMVLCDHRVVYSSNGRVIDVQQDTVETCPLCDDRGMRAVAAGEGDGDGE